MPRTTVMECESCRRLWTLGNVKPNTGCPHCKGRLFIASMDTLVAKKRMHEQNYDTWEEYKGDK